MVRNIVSALFGAGICVMAQGASAQEMAKTPDGMNFMSLVMMGQVITLCEIPTTAASKARYDMLYAKYGEKQTEFTPAQAKAMADEAKTSIAASKDAACSAYKGATADMLLSVVPD